MSHEVRKSYSHIHSCQRGIVSGDPRVFFAPKTLFQHPGDGRVKGGMFRPCPDHVPTMFRPCSDPLKSRNKVGASSKESRDLSRGILP